MPAKHRQISGSTLRSFVFVCRFTCCNFFWQIWCEQEWLTPLKSCQGLKVLFKITFFCSTLNEYIPIGTQKKWRNKSSEQLDSFAHLVAFLNRATRSLWFLVFRRKTQDCPYLMSCMTQRSCGTVTKPRFLVGKNRNCLIILFGTTSPLCSATAGHAATHWALI